MAIKECKECGNQVSTKALSCPSCGAVLKKKTGCLGYILLVFVLLMVIGIFNATDKTSKQQNTSTSEQANSSILRQIEDKVMSPSSKETVSNNISVTSKDIQEVAISITSEKLIYEYQTDESTAEVQYGNKLLAITGIVSGIVTVPISVKMKAEQEGMAADAFFITMGGSRPTSTMEAMSQAGVMLFFGGGYASIPNQIKEGASVTIIGKCQGKMINAIQIEDCRLQTPQEPSNESVLDKYIGQSPSDIFNEETIDSKFKSILSDNYDSFKDRLNVSSGIKYKDGYYIGEGCMSHDCPNNAAAFVINKQSETIYAAMLIDKKQTLLFGIKNKTDLPEALSEWCKNYGGSWNYQEFTVKQSLDARIRHHIDY